VATGSHLGEAHGLDGRPDLADADHVHGSGDDPAPADVPGMASPVQSDPSGAVGGSAAAPATALTAATTTRRLRWWQWTLIIFGVLAVLGALVPQSDQAGTAGGTSDATVRSCASLQARHYWLVLQAAMAQTGNASGAQGAAAESELGDVERVMRQQGC
jgi:hypothetical protein